jgi:hypothetical protein
VLTGTYPNPTFAVDMATQAELDAAIIGAGGGPTGPAGGVLSGTYPNPGFADDLATQAELEAALAEFSSSVFVADDTYGVTGDGIADDTAELNAAYQAVVADGGGVLLIPPGNYLVSGNGFHLNTNTKVEIWAYGAVFRPTASSTGVTIDPGVEGEAGLGTTIRGLRVVSTGSTQVGFKFRNANKSSLRDCRVDNGSIGILFSNDGGGRFNEQHGLLNCEVNSATTGIKWEAINGGDVSMETQTFVNVRVGGFTTGWHIGSGVNMESVEMVNCMIQAAGVTGATCIYTQGNLKGWRVSAIAEHLNSSNPNCVVMNNDVGTTNNNLADIRLYCLPQTTGATSATWAATPFIKHASLTQPTIINEGNVHSMLGAVGNYVLRLRRDFEPNDRFRMSYAGFDWGPGGASPVDTSVGRLGAGNFGNTTTTKLTGFGLDSSSQRIQNVAPGVASTDAATVGQLGGGGGGGSGVFVNVLDHGADGTGAADDTAAIQTAIGALATTGGTLYFPSGTYICTSATPAFDLPAGTTVLGDGRTSSLLKFADSPTDTTYLFQAASGRVAFKQIGLVGPDSYAGTTENVTAIRTANVAGIEVYLEDCASSRLTEIVKMYDGVAQTLEVDGCDFDGSDIGNAAGEAMDNCNGLTVPNVGGGLIARHSRFRRLGSDTAGGTNNCHAIYAREETSVQIEGCLFEAHRDGRYVQVNGNAAGSPPAPDKWAIRDCNFGSQVVGSEAVHTSPQRRALIAECEFAHTKTGIYTKGNATIIGCNFRGGSSNTFYSIQVTGTSPKVFVVGCHFEGSQAIDIFLDANSTELSVLACAFRGSSSLSHIRQNAGRTLVTVIAKSCMFFPAAGAAGIDTDTSGTSLLFQITGCHFNGGAYGVRVPAGGTCFVLNLRNNDFTNQTTAAVTKAGTVSSEASKGNQGYVDTPDPIALGTDWSAGDRVSGLIAIPPPALRADIRHGTAASPVTVAGPTLRVSRTDACTNATTAAAGENLAVETTAAIVGSVKQQGNSESQVCGVVGEAKAGSTSAVSYNDACGVLGWARTEGDGVAAGSYVVGVLAAAASSSAIALGIEPRVTNVKASHNYASAGPSKTMGIWVNAGGGAGYTSACAIQIGGVFDQVDVGLGINAGSCVSSAMRDDSDAARSLDIRGIHGTASIETADGAGPTVLNNNYIQQTERSAAPTAPPPTMVRIYAIQDAGKTSLKARFASGAVQTIATEP